MNFFPLTSFWNLIIILCGRVNVLRKLGSFETAQAFTNELFAFNAVVVVGVSGGLKKESLNAGLLVLQKRHPLLQARIVKQKGSYYFDEGDRREIPVDVITIEENKSWQEVVEKELDLPFRQADEPLMRVTFLRSSESDTDYLILTFHHAIVDAPSAGAIVKELLTFLGQEEAVILADGEVQPYPPLQPAEHYFPKEFRGWRLALKNASYMNRQMADEALFRMRSRGRRKALIHESGHCKILPLQIPKEASDALAKHARKRRLTINSLFAAAMMKAVHKHLYNEEPQPLRHFSIANLRPYSDPPLPGDFLGGYFAMMRFTMKMDKHEGIWELARRVNDEVYRMAKRGDKFSANVLGKHMMKALFKFKSFRMGTTALSYTGSLDLDNQYGNIQVKRIHAFVSNFPLGPEFTAQARLFNGEFYWDILYLDSDMNRQKAEAIAGELDTILDAAIQNEE
jgi:NRPS condensation-like uncharacterized protein